MMRAVLLAAFVTLGCVGDPLPLTNCTAGVQTACACPGGSVGAQRCAADGSGFGACGCPDAAPADVVETDTPPDAVAPDTQTVDVVDVPAPDTQTVDVVDVPADRPDAVDAPRVTCPTGQTACGVTCINLNTAPDHCGACDNFCPMFPHVITVCQSGRCSDLGCETGRQNCNTRLDDGCEAVPTTDPRNCGMCGRVCSSGRCFNGNCAP